MEERFRLIDPQRENIYKFNFSKGMMKLFQVGTWFQMAKYISFILQTISF